MPFCEQCSDELKRDELYQEVGTKKILCASCAAGKTLVRLPPKEDRILGRTYDYSVAFTRENGLEARGRVGGMKLTFQVDNEEIARVFGPQRR
jgi:hypothetical protein